MDSYLLEHCLRDALVLTLIFSAIPLGAAMIVGLLCAVFQAATQIQEQTLTFVPKLAAVCLVIFVIAPWVNRELVTFCSSVLQQSVAWRW